MLTTETEVAIKALITKISTVGAGAITAGEVLHLSQAALNLAHVGATQGSPSAGDSKPPTDG